MLRPSLGELLHGIRIGLEDSVLPQVPKGNAERQLKAALHALRRAERCWDRTGPSLRLDNADSQASASSVLARALSASSDANSRTCYAALQARLDSADPPPLTDGRYTDTETATLAARNAALQQVIAELDATLRADASLPAAVRRELRTEMTAFYQRSLGRDRYQQGLDADTARPASAAAPATLTGKTASTADAGIEDTLQTLEVVEDALDGVDVVAERVVVEADGVISITLAAASGRLLPAWRPGAHIDLIFDGKLERQYSLCGDPQDARHWTVAVLREPNSRGGSAWLHGSLRQGDRLRARGPRNNFTLDDAEHYVFVAGGVGITPIITMVREAAQLGKPWTLVYGGRRRASMAFLPELQAHGERVTIWPQDERGLIDLATAIGAPRAGTAVYCCGPEPLINAVEQHCQNWPEGALHIERFRPRSDLPQTVTDSFEVALARSGKSVTVGADETIAGALEKIGVIVPTSCGEGTCGTCATKLLEGTPDHRDSFLIGRKRKENKTIMACCSRALSPRLVLDL